jgi:NAD(P)-dependent dehydrogenase (short-subunit alcohol dehydrogenase family)/acyl carrier protein
LQNGILIADLTIFSESGQLISQIDGLTFQQARPETLFSQTNDLKDSLYEITWQATDLTGMDWTETGDWLIFADKKGVGQQLAEKLAQQGHRCQLITENNRQTWQYFLKKPYQGLIYLWGIDDDQALENNQNLAVTQERICGTLLEIVQELGKIEVNYSPRLYIVTQSAQYIPSQPTVIALAQSSLWGLGRTIALEHPELRCLCLDGDKFQDSHTLALEVFQSLQSSEEENQIVWRQGQSYVARLGRFIPKSSLKNREIAENATYLITGGLGALGQQVANWLRKKGAKSLVLLSRRGITPETQPIIDQWRQEGTNVEVFAADVSDFGQMRRAFEIIEQQLPPLKGIIHTAGVLEDASLSKQTWEKFERVFSPKILGAWNLHLLSQEVDLDWFISFSSMASVLGSSGQSNYASANAFLDSLAHYRQAQGLPALTINWGPWAEGGMAENLGEKAKKRLIKQGFTPLDPQKCLHLLETLLKTSRTQVTVASLNWNSFFNSFENQKIPPLLRDFQSFSAPKLTPDNNFIDVLMTVPIEERFAALTAHVQGIVAEILGIPAREFTKVDQGFFELGMDSLMTVELRNCLAKDLGKSLAATITFKYPTVTSLVDYLVAEVIDLDFSLKPLAIGANQDSNLDLLNEEDLSLEELSDLLLQELNSLS